MSANYTLYVSMVSPYAMKVATLLGYAGVPVELTVQNLVSRYAVIRRLSGKTMVPMLRRGDWALNDSTAIARWTRETFPGRPLVPEAAGREALAWILEDFADEWLIYVMALSRWGDEADRRAMVRLIGRELTVGAPVVSRAAGKAAVAAIEKQMRRGGVREINRAAIMASRDRILNATEGLFDSATPYLFGGRPSVADFALFGPLGQYARDPSGRQVVAAFPATRRWLHRIWAWLPPAADGVVDEDAAPRPLEALRPLFAEFLGTYWRVLVENHRVKMGAVKSKGKKGSHEVTLLDGSTFHFRPSRYLTARLGALLGLLNTAYGERQELFGPEGLGLEDPLIQAVARLTSYRAGVELLRDYPNIGA